MSTNLQHGQHRTCPQNSMSKLILSTISIILLAGLFSVEYINALPADIRNNSAILGYTHQRSDGNRFVEGKGTLPQATIIDIELDGTPEWVVAVPFGDASLWAVTLNDGRVQAFRVDAEGAEPAQIGPHQLEPGQAPLLSIQDGIPSLVSPISDDFSPTTHPIKIPEKSIQAEIIKDGALVLFDQNGQNIASLPVAALPDARLLFDESHKFVLLTNPTTTYTHGVLGDQIEAVGITIVDLSSEPIIAKNVLVPAGQVIEGIAPTLADWNGDGEQEIIVTLSDANQGAQLVVFNTEGEIIGQSDTLGQGYRWRHQIAVAPFGPNGEMELVDVLTPHIGGVIEFFQWHDSKLEKVAQVSGYSSHRIGSRNLDMAAAGDFDGDGQIELLIPGQSFSHLGGIQRTQQGAEVTWTLPTDGIITTNIGAVNLINGEMAIAVGTERKLRIWYPTIISD